MKPMLAPFAILALLASTLTLSSSQGSGVQRVAANHPGALTGLGSVYVLVELMDPQVAADGLSTKEVQAAVEDRLEAAGIPTISKADHKPTTPVLYVNVSTVPDRENRDYLYFVQVKVEENVTLQRNPKMLIVHAATWHQETFGRVSRHTVETLSVEAEDLVDEFIKQYRQTNPARHSEK